MPDGPRDAQGQTRRTRDREAFTGSPGNFRRTERRHDYAVEPPAPGCWIGGVDGKRRFYDIRRGQDSRYFLRARPGRISP